MLGDSCGSAALFAESYAFSAGQLKKLGRLRRCCRLLTSTLIFLPAHSKKIRRRSQMFLFLGV
jgi:hypothetical protein